MKSVYVADLADGDDLLNEAFLLEDVAIRETKNGRPYLLITFRDKTGQISGVFWDVPDDIESWVRTSLVTLVTGRVSNYKNALQIICTDLNLMMDPDMTLFLPESSRTRESMIGELREIIDGLEEPWKGLVSRLLLDPNFLDDFSTAPAARRMHHAYIGGLMEHSLSMAQIALFLADHYPYVNKDLLVSGAFLHDIGKTMEYGKAASFDFSDDGRLVGHIVRAIVMVERASDDLSHFSEDDLRQIIHLIASHHGTQEWGSPVIPKTLEAVLLHQIDLLDSRAQGFFDHLNNESSKSLWTTKSSYMFGTELRRPPDFE